MSQKVPVIAQMHKAAQLGDVENLKRLIGYGYDVCSKDEQSGWQPLHYAVYGHHVHCVKVLYMTGKIDLNVMTPDGMRCLHLLFKDDTRIQCDAELYETALFLLENCADPNLLSILEDETALATAVKNKASLKIIELLLNFTTNIDGSGAYGQTPLFLALGWHSSKIVAIILNKKPKLIFCQLRGIKLSFLHHFIIFFTKKQMAKTREDYYDSLRKVELLLKYPPINEILNDIIYQSYTGTLFVKAVAKRDYDLIAMMWKYGARPALPWTVRRIESFLTTNFDTSNMLNDAFLSEFLSARYLVVNPDDRDLEHYFDNEGTKIFYSFHHYINEECILNRLISEGKKEELELFLRNGVDPEVFMNITGYSFMGQVNIPRALLSILTNNDSPFVVNNCLISAVVSIPKNGQVALDIIKLLLKLGPEGSSSNSSSYTLNHSPSGQHSSNYLLNHSLSHSYSNSSSHFHTPFLFSNYNINVTSLCFLLLNALALAQRSTSNNETCTNILPSQLRNISAAIELLILRGYLTIPSTDTDTLSETKLSIGAIVALHPVRWSLFLLLWKFVPGQILFSKETWKQLKMAWIRFKCKHNLSTSEIFWPGCLFALKIINYFVPQLPYDAEDVWLQKESLQTYSTCCINNSLCGDSRGDIFTNFVKDLRYRENLLSFNFVSEFRQVKRLDRLCILSIRYYVYKKGVPLEGSLIEYCQKNRLPSQVQNLLTMKEICREINDEEITFLANCFNSSD